MGDDVQIVLAKLDALRDRFDDEREAHVARHSEIVDRMVRIESEVRRTNGRVTTLEAVVDTLREELTGIRKRWHAFRESIQTFVRISSGENRQLTMRDVYVFVGGISTFYALAKVLRWL